MCRSSSVLDVLIIEVELNETIATKVNNISSRNSTVGIEEWGLRNNQITSDTDNGVFSVTISVEMHASSSSTVYMRDKYAYLRDNIKEVDENPYILCQS